MSTPGRPGSEGSPGGGRREPSGDPPRPPDGATRLLARVLRDDPAGPAILGDLHEEFVRRHGQRGGATAGLWYWWEAIGLALGRVRPFRGGPTPRTSIGLRTLRGDTDCALRALRRSPGFALFTAVVVGMGVGATTTVYSVLEPLVLAPLPFEEPERLVWIENGETPGDRSLESITSRTANLHDFRERAGSFEAITGYNAFFRYAGYTLTGLDEPEHRVGVGVAHDFLDVLGVQPLHGRGFTAEEGRPGGPEAVLLSYGFWRGRFAGDPSIVGRTITLDHVPRAVVGVLPRTFDFASIFEPGAQVDLLLPFPVLPAGGGGYQGNRMFLVGRLRPGVGIEAAAHELDALILALQEEQPGRWGLGAELMPLRDHVAGPFRPALMLLVAAAGTLLLIVCVNVSNLLLARSPTRAREMAVRKALGASRGRLVRQLVLEMVGIALAGATLGAASAWAATGVVAGTSGIQIPMLDRVAVDGSALLFATVVAVLTGLVVGLVPALQVAEGGEAAALRSAASASSQSRSARRLREMLVVAQVALVCVLLVVGGLLARSLRAVLDVDLGFDPEGVVAWQLDPGRDFETPAERSAFFGALADRVRVVPGVERAGLIDGSPLGRDRSWPFSVVGRPEREDSGERLQIHPHVVDPGYLSTMGIPVLAGRNFTADDTGEASPVVMMNESGARRVFGSSRAALGRTVRTWGDWEWEVVGIVEDVRHLSPETEASVQVYFPITQMTDYATVDLVVRSPLPAERTSAAVMAALREVVPAMPVREFWTMRSVVERATSARRFTISILGVYGAAALFLAALGIYGVLAQSVAERRAEISIRMALGASAPEVVQGVLGRTLTLAGIGIVVGGALSLLGSGLLESLLFGVGARDPVTFLGMTLVLLLVAAAAGAVPAARAARVRGVGALRGD